MKIALIFTGSDTTPATRHMGQRITCNEFELDAMIRTWRTYGYKLSDYWYLDLTPARRP